MKTLRWVGLSLALSITAACGGGSHPSALSPNVTAPVNGSSSSGPKSTMTITITRSAAPQSTAKRSAQTIPLTAMSVDAQIWLGSGTSGTAAATSCVSFPANATSATLSIIAPQGLETIQIASWSGACTGSGGQGTTGQGAILSEFTGSGTVLSTSTTLAGVFNNGVQIVLTTPAGGTGTILTGPTTYNVPGIGPSWGAPGVAGPLNFPVQSGFDGHGMTVAIVIDSSVLSSDYGAYLTAFQIPATTRTINFESVNNAPIAVSSDADSATEAALDLETVAGLAPGANIIVYVINGLDSYDIDLAYNQIISDGVANIVNSSFGGCEFMPAATPSGDSVEQAIFANGTSSTHKITFVASSGDQGSACYQGGNPQFAFGVNYPASDPNVVGVGGTDTNYGNAITDPAVWNDLAVYGGGGSGGGGVSAEFATPTYQNGVKSVLASQTMRNVPDVTGPAAYSAIYQGGSWGTVDGTSWSSPQFAAELSEIYEYCQTAFANPVALLYSVYASAPSAFIDVTHGNNYWGYGSAGQYTSATGPDNTSGLGIVQGMNFAQALCPNRTPSITPVAPVISISLKPAAPRLVPVPYNIPSYGTDDGERSASSRTQVAIGILNTSSVADNEQAVLAALTNAGFTIDKTFSNHLLVAASAPNSTVEGFLTTSVHNVTQGVHGVRAGQASSLTIPAAIAPYISGIHVGNLITYKTGPVKASPRI